MTVTAADYRDVLGRFPERRESHTFGGRPAWYGPCPVCGDRCRTHLRLWIGHNDRLYAKCYGGKCSQVPHREWFGRLIDVVGGTMGEWFPPDGDRPHRPREARPVKIVATYDYADARGRLLYQCVKYEPGSPQKNGYRRPAHAKDAPAKVTEDGGKRWVWDGAALDLDKLESGEVVPARHVLYRGREMLAADPRLPVLVPEGEPDVEALRSLGFVAVCNPHGSRNWPDYLGESLTGRRCVLFEDNDDAGRLHVSHVAGVLIGHSAASVRLVRFRPFPEHCDVSAWLYRTFGEKPAPEMPNAYSCPAHSYQIPAWAAALDAKTRAKVRGAVADLCKLAPEWSVLTEAESAARLAAMQSNKVGEPMTLQEGMAQQGRAA